MQKNGRKKQNEDKKKRREKIKIKKKVGEEMAQWLRGLLSSFPVLTAEAHSHL